MIPISLVQKTDGSDKWGWTTGDICGAAKAWTDVVSGMQSTTFGSRLFPVPKDAFVVDARGLETRVPLSFRSAGRRVERSGRVVG